VRKSLPSGWADAVIVTLVPDSGFKYMNVPPYVDV
jgi:hypothetical protein